MWTVGEGQELRFRCRSGHAWDAPDSLLTDRAASVEHALWAAVRALEEQASLARSLQRRSERRHSGKRGARGGSSLGRRYARRAGDAEREAVVIRRLLADPTRGGAD
jgi:two-component system chemotaxis response regulator CheB